VVPTCVPQELKPDRTRTYNASSDISCVRLTFCGGFFHWNGKPGTLVASKKVILRYSDRVTGTPLERPPPGTPPGTPTVSPPITEDFGQHLMILSTCRRDLGKPPGSYVFWGPGTLLHTRYIDVAPEKRSELPRRFLSLPCPGGQPPA
jgi:hypothetical protein